MLIFLYWQKEERWKGGQPSLTFICKDLNVSPCPLPPMLMNVLFKRSNFQTWKKIFEKVCGDLKIKGKAVAESRQNAVCVGSGKTYGGNSRDLNEIALKAIPLLVYKLKDGVRANFLISTAWALQSRLFSFLIVTCTVSQLSVLAQKSVCIYLHRCIWS